LLLGIGVITMKEKCAGGGDVLQVLFTTHTTLFLSKSHHVTRHTSHVSPALQCQSVTTLFTLWFFKAPWPQPLTFVLSETLGACLSLAIM
jgi:hypothetical protein